MRIQSTIPKVVGRFIRAIGKGEAEYYMSSSLAMSKVVDSEVAMEVVVSNESVMESVSNYKTAIGEVISDPRGLKYFFLSSYMFDNFWKTSNSMPTQTFFDNGRIIAEGSDIDQEIEFTFVDNRYTGEGQAVRARSQGAWQVYPSDEHKYWGIEIDFDDVNTLHIDVDGSDSELWDGERHPFIAVDDPSDDDVQNKIWTGGNAELHELSLDVSNISGINELRLGFYWDTSSESGHEAIFQGIKFDY